MAKKTFAGYARSAGELAVKVVVGALFLVFGVGSLIIEDEPIPDNAEVVAIHVNKKLLPMNNVGKDYVYGGEGDATSPEFSVITYGLTRDKSSKYADYEFHWDFQDCTVGATGPIYVYPFLKRRWTKEGDWNW